MKTAYCTHCQKVTMMRIAVTKLPVADSEGKGSKTTIETHHCVSCGLFTGSVASSAASTVFPSH